MHDVVSGLQNVKDLALEFNANVFGNIGYQKKKLEAKIKGIEKALESWNLASLELLLKELQEEYAQVLL